jgi:outer membrane protein TolC
MTGRALATLVGACVVGCATAPRIDADPPPRPALTPELRAARIDLMARTGEGPEVPAVRALPATAGEGLARIISLEEAMRIATVQGLDVALARADAEVAKAKTRVARSGLFPELEAGAAASRRDGTVQGSFGDSRDVAFSTYEPSAALVYRKNVAAEIFRASSSAFEEEAALLERADTEQVVALRVAELYHGLLAAKAGLRIAEQLERDNVLLSRVVSAREEAGITSGSDGARAAARLAAARQEVITARRLRDQASIGLAVALRLDPGVPLEPMEERLDVASHAGTTGWDATARAARRPAVVASERRVRAADRARSGATWDLLAPSLSAELRRSWVSRNASDFGGRTSYGALLLWTLSEAKLARLEQADATAAKARASAERVREQARGAVVDARQGVGAAAERIPLSRQQLVAAETAWRIALARLRDGTGTALEVFETEDDVARARLGLARSIISFNLSQIRLLAAAGALVPQRRQLP